MAWCGFWPINAHHNLTFILFQGTFKRHIIFFSVYLAQLIFVLSYRPIYQLQEDDTYTYFYLCTTASSDTKHWWLRRVTLTYKGFQIQSTATSFLHIQICPTILQLWSACGGKYNHLYKTLTIEISATFSFSLLSDIFGKGFRVSILSQLSQDPGLQSFKGLFLIGSSTYYYA